MRKSPSANENWTKNEVLTLIKRSANEALAECKRKESGQNIIYVPHPTIPKTFIRKII
jgi:hypothetical protein